MGKTIDAAIASVASCRLGLITRQQLLDLGLSESAISKRIAGGRLSRRFAGVYAIPGLPRSWDQDLVAAQLAAGTASAISHQAAGRVWVFEGVTASCAHVVVTHRRTLRLCGVIVHRTRTLERRDVVRRGVLLVTSPSRTIIDLAGVLTGHTLEDVLDDVIRRGIVSVASMRRRAAKLGRGTPGAGTLKALPAGRTRETASGSSLENRFRRKLRSLGLPAPRAQFSVCDASGRIVARVDFAYPDARLAIEVDGFAFHSGRRTWEADLVRQNRLVALGWRPLRVTSSDLTTDEKSPAFDAIAQALDDATA